MAYFTEWEDNVTAYYKAKYEREKLERAEKEKARCAEQDKSREECADNPLSEIEKDKIRKEEKEREKAFNKNERMEKQKMNSNIDKSQLAKETRCGLNFTGEDQ